MNTKKIYIGTPLKRGTIISYGIAIMLYSCIISLILFLFFKWFLRFTLTLSLSILVYVIIVAIYTLMLMPHLGDMEYLSIDDEYLKYYYAKSFSIKWQYIKAFFHNQEPHPTIMIPIDQIEAVRISYGYGLAALTFFNHTPYFSFLLKDSSLCNIKCNYVLKGFEGYQEMLNILEKRNIPINDCYQLRQYLYNKDVFGKAIRSLEKEEQK